MEKKKLLVVDDEKMSRDILIEIFKNEFDAIEAESGEEAIEIAIKEGDCIAAITLDIILPGLSGYDVLKKLKTFPVVSEIPIIAITSLEDADSEVKVLELGAYDSIRKPFDTRIVSHRVRNAIISREITRMKLENSHLRELDKERSRLKEVLSNMNGGIILLEMTKTLNLIYANRNMFEYTRQEGADSEQFFAHMSEIIHPSDLSQLMDIMERTAKRGIASEMDCRFFEPGRKVAWMRVSVSSVEYLDYRNPVLLLHFTDVTEEKKTERLLIHRAEHDKLTGIYNREAFIEKTEAMLLTPSNEKFLLMRINVMGFKFVNEALGKEAGDKLLITIANTLHAVIETNGTYGRLQGDNFIACVAKSGFDPDEYMERLLVRVENLSLRTRVTLAMGIYEIEDISMPVDRMSDRAKLALDTVSGKYAKNYAYYDDSIRKKMLAENEMVANSSMAFENEEFVVYLQPIYSLSMKSPISAEALVRWISPEKGMIKPDSFIPVFERNGLIQVLDYYVFHHVCEYLEQSLRQGKKVVPVSVNVSRYSLYDPDFPEKLSKVAKHYGVPFQYIAIEITESLYIDNPKQLSEALDKLHDRGFKIYMDDFGSGYSSLNMLKDLNVDVLKIDMLFLKDFETSPKAGNILTSVVRMAKWLKIPVIAEGVETKAQIDFLRSIGCDRIQGYYFSKPVNTDEYEKLLNSSVEMEASPLEKWEKDIDFDQLLNGNQLMNKVFNSYIGAIGIYEFSGTALEIIRVNDGYYSMFGYTPQSFHLDAANALQRVIEEDRKRMIVFCNTAVKEGTVESAVFRRRSQNGDIQWINTKAILLGGSEDRPLIILALNDITYQKINEEKIMEQNLELARNYEFVETLRNGMLCGMVESTTDEKSTIISVNRYTYEILGYENEAPLIGKSIIDALAYDDDRERLREGLNELRSGEVDKQDFEFRVKCADGLYKWIRGSNEIERLMDTEMLMSVFTDVTTEKRAASEQSLLMQNLPAGFAVYEIKGKNNAKILYYSEKTIKILSLSKKEKSEYEKSSWKSRYFPRICEQLGYEEVISGKEFIAVVNGIKEASRRQDGREFRLRFHGTCKKNEEGKLMCYTEISEIPV